MKRLIFIYISLFLCVFCSGLRADIIRYHAPELASQHSIDMPRLGSRGAQNTCGQKRTYTHSNRAGGWRYSATYRPYRTSIGRQTSQGSATGSGTYAGTYSRTIKPLSGTIGIASVTTQPRSTISKNQMAQIMRQYSRVRGQNPFLNWLNSWATGENPFWDYEDDGTYYYNANTLEEKFYEYWTENSHTADDEEKWEEFWAWFSEEYQEQDDCQHRLPIGESIVPMIVMIIIFAIYKRNSIIY